MGLQVGTQSHVGLPKISERRHTNIGTATRPGDKTKLPLNIRKLDNNFDVYILVAVGSWFDWNKSVE